MRPRLGGQGASATDSARSRLSGCNLVVGSRLKAADQFWAALVRQSQETGAPLSGHSQVPANDPIRAPHLKV